MNRTGNPSIKDKWHLVFFDKNKFQKNLSPTSNHNYSSQTCWPDLYNDPLMTRLNHITDEGLFQGFLLGLFLLFIP